MSEPPCPRGPVAFGLRDRGGAPDKFRLVAIAGRRFTCPVALGEIKQLADNWIRPRMDERAKESRVRVNRNLSESLEVMGCGHVSFSEPTLLHLSDFHSCLATLASTFRGA